MTHFLLVLMGAHLFAGVLSSHLPFPFPFVFVFYTAFQILYSAVPVFCYGFFSYYFDEIPTFFKQIIVIYFNGCQVCLTPVFFCCSKFSGVIYCSEVLFREFLSVLLIF